MSHGSEFSVGEPSLARTGPPHLGRGYPCPIAYSITLAQSLLDTVWASFAIDCVRSQEVRIMGSKANYCMLAAASSAKTAGFGVPSFVPKWRARRDSNS